MLCSSSSMLDTCTRGGWRSPAVSWTGGTRTGWASCSTARERRGDPRVLGPVVHEAEGRHHEEPGTGGGRQPAPRPPRSSPDREEKQTECDDADQPEIADDAQRARRRG